MCATNVDERIKARLRKGSPLKIIKVRLSELHSTIFFDEVIDNNCLLHYVVGDRKQKRHFWFYSDYSHTPEIAQYFIDHCGANVNELNEEGKTPLDIVMDIVEVFRNWNMTEGNFLYFQKLEHLLKERGGKRILQNNQNLASTFPFCASALHKKNFFKIGPLY